MPDDDPKEAYDLLMKSVGATHLAREIQTIVAQGKLRTPTKGNEFTQERLSDTEAYVVAVRLVLAALDPIFMVSEALADLQKLSSGKVASIKWEFDRVEALGVLLEETLLAATLPGEPVEIPHLDQAEIAVLRKQTDNVLQLCDELARKAD